MAQPGSMCTQCGQEPEFAERLANLHTASSKTFSTGTQANGAQNLHSLYGTLACSVRARLRSQKVSPADMHLGSHITLHLSA